MKKLSESKKKSTLKKNQKGPQTTGISLFCGAGGMDLGFEKAGIKIIWAIDSDRDACMTYSHWSKTKPVNLPVEKVIFSKLPKVDVIIGGFPCQGFSGAGPRDEKDPRNKMYTYFSKAVEELKPKVFVAENVKGILSLGKGKIFKKIIKSFENKGYSVEFKLLNSADFGVPEIRERVIIVGKRNDLSGSFTFPKPKSKRVTIKDAIYNCKFIKEEVLWTGYSSRYMSRNRVKDWNEQSFTIPAMARQVPLHPSSGKMIQENKDEWVFETPSNVRRLSWREAALIQTFPKRLIFFGDLESKYRQIGNAVPVKLAQEIAKKVEELIRNSDG